MAYSAIRCSECGGTEIDMVGHGVGKCKSCSASVLISEVEDAEIIALLNQAFLFRKAFDFDMAIKTYELVLTKEKNNTAALEGLLLSKYGIEYIDDTRTGKKVPTCHRLNFHSINSDPTYIALLECLEGGAKIAMSNRMFEIEKLTDAIKERLKNERTYDVFLSYKAGAETEDAFIAREIYDELSLRGYDVFYAEKSLENRVGEMYEPIIYKALNSAKVFILVGTSEENINSVWVRNEWSRFIERIKDSTDSVKASAFVPVFKNVSPYVFPTVKGRAMQGVDASKIGYYKVVADGVDRLIGNPQTLKKEEPKKEEPFKENIKNEEKAREQAFDPFKAAEEEIKHSQKQKETLGSAFKHMGAAIKTTVLDVANTVAASFKPETEEKRKQREIELKLKQEQKERAKQAEMTAREKARQIEIEQREKARVAEILAREKARQAAFEAREKARQIELEAKLNAIAAKKHAAHIGKKGISETEAVKKGISETEAVKKEIVSAKEQVIKSQISAEERARDTRLNKKKEKKDKEEQELQVAAKGGFTIFFFIRFFIMIAIGFSINLTGMAIKEDFGFIFIAALFIAAFALYSAFHYYLCKSKPTRELTSIILTVLTVIILVNFFVTIPANF